MTDKKQMQEAQSLKFKSKKITKEAKLSNMRVYQEINDNLNMLMEEKKLDDAYTHPDPGRNTKR